MGILDGILGQLGGGGLDPASLGARVGLSPEQVQMALAALAQAHPQPGDTATQAAGETGLPADTLQQLIAHIGGEEMLGKLGGLLGGSGGVAGGLGGLAGGLGGVFGKN